MIDVLNGLDGDPAAFDPRMFAVFGNHEFEKDKTKDAALLDRRIEESQFRWLDGNVTFAAGADGPPVVAAPNLAPTWIVESGGIRIGIFGLTIDIERLDTSTDFADPVATARAAHRRPARPRGRGGRRPDPSQRRATTAAAAGGARRRRART